MNYGLITLTFISVNLDFFLMMLFLLRQYRFRQVLVGYLIGTLLLVTLSFVAGQFLAALLPEWVLGILGVLQIWLAFRDDDDDNQGHGVNGTWGVMLTYLSVCAGCNLSLFLPVLANQRLANFGMILALVTILTVVAVVVINLVGKLPVIVRGMDRFGESLMKICYVAIGCYVFYDSGLVTHLLQWL